LYTIIAEKLKVVTKEKLREILKTSREPITVTFKKANGATREMLCTLNPSYIPENLLGSAGKAKEQPHLLTVYDLEEDAWRSINFTHPVHYETEVLD
jgi:hypothetical protein